MDFLRRISLKVDSDLLQRNQRKRVAVRWLSVEGVEGVAREDRGQGSVNPTMYEILHNMQC